VAEDRVEAVQEVVHQAVEDPHQVEEDQVQEEDNTTKH